MAVILTKVSGRSLVITQVAAVPETPGLFVTGFIVRRKNTFVGQRKLTKAVSVIFRKPRASAKGHHSQITFFSYLVYDPKCLISNERKKTSAEGNTLRGEDIKKGKY